MRLFIVIAIFLAASSLAKSSESEMILESLLGGSADRGRFSTSGDDWIEIFPPVSPNELEVVMVTETKREFVSVAISIFLLTSIEKFHLSVTPRVPSGNNLEKYRIRATLTRKGIAEMIKKFYPRDSVSVLLGAEYNNDGIHPGWSDKARNLLYSDTKPGLNAAYEELIRQSNP